MWFLQCKSAPSWLADCWDTASAQANQAEADSKSGDDRLSRLVTSDIAHLNVRMWTKGQASHTQVIPETHIYFLDNIFPSLTQKIFFVWKCQCKQRVNRGNRCRSELLSRKDIFNKIILLPLLLSSLYSQTDFQLLALPAGKWPSLSAPCLVLVGLILLPRDRFSLWVS